MSEQKHPDKLIAMQRLNPWYWEELCKKSGKDIRRLCFDARVSKNLDIFLMFRQQILMNMKIMETIFDNDKKRHVGVYIESPSNERHNGMRAVVHPSRIGDLYGLKLQREIQFVKLNAAQLKEIYKFLRAHVIFVKCNDLRVIFYECVVDADDLAAFCNNVVREKQIHEVYFEYGTTFRQRFSYLLSNICSTRIYLRALPTCSSPVNATNDFFANTDRRQNLIEDLEIEYAEQPFEDQICANFIKKNIKEKGKFAISIWRMRAPASKAKDLGAAFGPFNRQLAFHRIRGAGAWGYESV
uniref:Uncharacterized protein n=1 Tax=Panagrolaimus davidi TaxID=227884 RepID=A0A914PWR2_9BILA